MSLSKILNENKSIKIDIGEFHCLRCLGEGGNSFVFQFKKGKIDFAIKFLKSTEESKLKRFKDEYFCSTLIHSHENIARTYHFDKLILNDEERFIIIMKYYDGTLSSEGSISRAKYEDGRGSDTQASD